MPLLIDGHNLIPKIPGLSLSLPDDERRLIEMVQEYCRIRRKQAELYFDNAPPGTVRVQQMGLVQVKFTRAGHTADQEIKGRLKRLGRQASNWVVVTSDHSIQVEARAVRAQVITADTFARDLLAALREGSSPAGSASEAGLSPEEVEFWLRQFKEGKKK